MINRAAGFASANRDKERTVRRHGHVRWRETVRADGFEKNFRLCFVAAAVRLEREKVNLAEGPIQNEQAVAIAFRKLVVPIAGHAGWRTTSDRPEKINCVRVIIGPVPTPFPAVQSPAVMTAKRDLIEPRRRVPGQEEIALHVAVVGEDVAEPVEIEVVRVPEAVRDDFRMPAIRRQAQQASRFRLANRRVRQRDVLLTEAGVVAADQVPPAVRPFAHRMTAMLGEMEREKFLRRTVRFAIAIAIVITRKPAVTGEVEIVPVKAHSHPAGFRLAKQRGFVRPAVAISVLQNPDPARTGDHDAPA